MSLVILFTGLLDGWGVRSIVLIKNYKDLPTVYEHIPKFYFMKNLFRGFATVDMLQDNLQLDFHLRL